jgi:hypothetical protein
LVEGEGRRELALFIFLEKGFGGIRVGVMRGRDKASKDFIVWTKR